MTDDTQEQSFVEGLPEIARPDWSPECRRQPPALDLVGAENDNGELTIMPAMGETTTEWISSDYYVEVGADE